ncbi:hypothetical protein [Aestuariibacter sp. A3R04]|uniref:hypothetical protein n=1 Tax=Aestuariibacter sp. A3R04 TaxID=2841571 RepID=UPI001C0A2460|nr:hypothetical protein [Aestuariibacter sp. A3R04]MBU3022998.1 hypothetical protein [Aestuariibacter sp. A3R04]
MIKVATAINAISRLSGNTGHKVDDIAVVQKAAKNTGKCCHTLCFCLIDVKPVYA